MSSHEQTAKALPWRDMTLFPPSDLARPVPPSGGQGGEGGFYARRLALPGAVLAPMAGYSDAPMRQLAAEAGALWTVSEMISARGLVLGGENESLTLGRPYPGEQERVVQLFGADPDLLASAVQRVEAWFAPAAIDLNMGCPVPKVRGKGGACLLQTPEVAYELIRAMKGATGLDISAKIRLGWDSNRSLEIAQGLSEAGAAVITVHGRTSQQRYTGEADWDAIAQVAASVPTPVIGSGDILSVQGAQQRQQLGVAAVMIGRGAVGNPWIFRALAQAGAVQAGAVQAGAVQAGAVQAGAMQYREGSPPSAQERAATALRHAQLQHHFYTAPHRQRPGELKVASMRPLRKVLPRYLPEHAELHPALTGVEVLADVERVLEPLLAVCQP